MREAIWILPGAALTGGVLAMAFVGYGTADMTLLLQALPFCGP